MCPPCRQALVSQLAEESLLKRDNVWVRIPSRAPGRGVTKRRMMSNQEALQTLNKRYMADDRFQHLHEANKNFVPGMGPLEPKLMMIGEAPGRVENAKKIPFVGPAGVNLTNLFEDVGIDQSEAYLTNVVKYWPPLRDGSHTPTEEEIEASREYLMDEIDIINPIIVGLCGRTPIHAIFPELNNVWKYHGDLLEGKFVPLYHPAVLSYQPHKKHLVREGYTKLKAYLDAKAVV